MFPFPGLLDHVGQYLQQFGLQSHCIWRSFGSYLLSAHIGHCVCSNLGATPTIVIVVLAVMVVDVVLLAVVVVAAVVAAIVAVVVVVRCHFM